MASNTNDKEQKTDFKNVDFAEECNRINPDYYPQWGTHMAHISDMHIFSEKDLDAMIPYIKIALRTGPIHLHICNLIVNEENGSITPYCDYDGEDEEEYEDGEEGLENEDKDEDDKFKLTQDDYVFVNRMKSTILSSTSNMQISDCYLELAKYCNNHFYGSKQYRKLCKMITE